MASAIVDLPALLGQTTDLVVAKAALSFERARKRLKFFDSHRLSFMRQLPRTTLAVQKSAPAQGSRPASSGSAPFCAAQFLTLADKAIGMQMPDVPGWFQPFSAAVLDHGARPSARCTERRRELAMPG